MAFQQAKRRSGKYGRQACHQRARRTHRPSIRRMAETHGRSGESVLSYYCQHGVTGKWNYHRAAYHAGAILKETKKGHSGALAEWPLG
jgi:hypothetical protein